MAYANVWGVPMAPDKGLFTETFDNPAAPEIDNSKEWYEILLQKGLEAAGTAIGGPAGTAVAGSINDMYDQSKAMPTVGTVPQQNSNMMKGYVPKLDREVGYGPAWEWDARNGYSPEMIRTMSMTGGPLSENGINQQYYQGGY